MKKTYPEKYSEYQSNVPFLLPLPKIINKVITFPLKITFKKKFPENGKEVIFIIAFYGTIFILISYILVICNVDTLFKEILRDLTY